MRIQDDDSEEIVLGKRKQPHRVKKQVRFNTVESSEELDHKIPSAKIYKEQSRLRSMRVAAAQASQEESTLESRRKRLRVNYNENTLSKSTFGEMDESSQEPSLQQHSLEVSEKEDSEVIP